STDQRLRHVPHPVRAMYVLLQMPQNTFLAVAIITSSVPLYAHYATLTRSWGPSALEDQQIAGSLMWIGGDALFIAAMAAVIAGWMSHEKRRAAGGDRQGDRERAEVRVRQRA